MVRTATVFALPAALVALAWLRLEQTPSGADALWVVLLALAPALAPRLGPRLALSLPAALTAAWVALDTPATDDRRGFFGPVLHRFGDGVLDYYDVQVPFSTLEQPHMHGVLVLAVFGFCLVLAHAVAARRPLPAVFAVIAGAGWPATLYPSRSIVYGALILAAALFVLAALRTTRPLPALVAGAALVLAAAGASTSAALAKDGLLGWERWDPNGGTSRPVSVSYVWDANYRGLRFAKKETTVLRVFGPARGFYWRATTLDQFDSDRWFENPTPLSTGPPAGRLPSDPLLPARSLNRQTWVKQDVEVVALRDPHVVGAAQAVALDGPQLGRVFRLSGGIVRVYRGLQLGQRYTVWSYAPRPAPAALARVGPEYPPALGRFLQIGRTRVEAFGSPGRDERVDALFADERYVALWPYEQMWNEARQLRAGARTPYGAVVAIETWLRSTGGFAYDETPPPAGGLPPLAHFVAEGKRGYCQHFAGAMALMLRFLGIPARVAAGFTSGKREDGGWTVTDHNAHAWVEVWFPEYGWLAFDPTPGRGSLAATYSASSTGFNAGDAAEAFGGASGDQARGTGADQLRLLEQRERLADRAAGGGGGGGGLGAFWLLLLVVLVGGAGIGAVKLVRSRLRYLTRDPRRLAGAARRELVDFLADQGLVAGPSATPQELHELVRAELGADGRRFAAALSEARFGPAAGAADAATRARHELRVLLRAIRRGLGRPARLRGLVALRSLRA
ncbi:MAG: protein-glutamine gamma-glutamyltransferase [Gaiellaceae bacterium]|nr:protein-glutamine gamma-glutamyltransferase [Gaiellaceae bacterium]